MGLDTHCQSESEYSFSPTSMTRSKYAAPPFTPAQKRLPCPSGMWKAKPPISGMAFR